MLTWQTLPALLIAAGIPAVFLLLLYMLDLYASRTFRLVMLCSVWGAGVGVWLAYLINTYIALPLIDEFGLTQILLYILFAPLVEESIKPLPLLYVSRRPEFTYFVDGAIYGFAGGIAFSIAENFIYVTRHPEVAIPLALLRALSTCLMHGVSAALVGAAVGLFRLRRYSYRRLMIVGTWLFAVSIHALFNSVVLLTPLGGRLEALAAVGIGLGGFSATILFVFLGLRQQRQWLAESLDRHLVDLLNADLTVQEREWLAETLDQQAGVSVAEVRASQAYEVLDEVLDPMAQQFPEKAVLMEQIVLQQAQIGIKRKVQDEVQDPGTKERLGQEIARLERDTRRLRREAGGRAMTYLQCVFGEKESSINACLEELVSCGGLGEAECREEQGEGSG